MKLKEFNKAFDIIKKIIIENNPHALITKGVNEYDFDSEIKGITKMIYRINSHKDASLVIQKVFFSSFYSGFDTDYDVLEHQIFDSLLRNNIITKI